MTLNHNLTGKVTYNEPMALNVDICIRGGGIVGTTLAVLLSRLQLRVALISNSSPTTNQSTRVEDIRAYAINAKSKSILESLNAWPGESACTEVRQMQVLSDSGEMIEFSNSLQLNALNTQDSTPMSWIVEVPALEAELAKALSLSNVQHITHGYAGAELQEIHAPLTVICEGSKSTTQHAVHSFTERISYGQVALATHVKFKDPHAKHMGVAYQWFNNSSALNTIENSNSEPTKEFEILAFLPIGGREGNTFAIVWSTTVERNAALNHLSDADFTDELRKSSKEFFKDLVPVSAKQSWPLALSSAKNWCGVFSPKESWVLCGDSAHSVHPLSGMGLNLGLGDVWALYELLLSKEKVNTSWRPLNDLRMLRDYERQRKLAILPYVQFIDKIQLLFASDYPLARLLRNKGFKTFNALGALKEWTIRKAMQAAL